MNYDEDSWRAFLTESRLPARKPRKLLRELDEDEYSLIEDAVNDMGPEDLAFNELFRGKERLVLDFPTMNTSNDLGKFVDMFREMGYDVDWEKGLISGVRKLQDSSVSALAARLGGYVDIPGQRDHVERKVQMKIGKFFGKIYELTSKRYALSQKVFDHLNSIGYTKGGYGALDKPGQLTGKMIAAALDEQEVKRYDQLFDQLQMYLGDLTLSSADAKKMQEYWQQNADYIKKNLDSLNDDKYSIIISRNPVDILRMSDFDRITSCHSPPSRGQSTDSSYYRCALAEAHGHGAIAYAVETEDLIKWTGRADLSMEELEDEIDGGEIFRDDSRRGTSMDGMITPVARLRLRQVRARGFGMPQDWDGADGVQIAVPEERVYGLKIPGFREKVFEWAKSTQTATIETIPADAIWTKYGGSYEDNNIRGLLQTLTGRDLEGIRQNSETEESLPDLDDLAGILNAETAAVDELVDEWNTRYQACELTASVEEDGGEGIYIEVECMMTIQWDADEWESLPTSSETVEGWMSEFEDMEWNWANSESWGTRVFALNNTADERIIHLRIDLDMSGITESESSFVHNSSEFEDLCVEVNRIDDMYDGIKAEITRMAKRDGLMDGGEMNNWGVEIENGEADYYEWDMTAEESDHMEYYGIEGSHTAYPAVPEGMSVQDARMVLESRDFTIPLRKALVEKAWAANQTSEEPRHYPDFRVYTEEIRTQDDENIRLVLTFYCDDNSTDAQVRSMKWAIEEWEDEEVLDAAIQAVFNQIVGGGLTGRGDMDVPPAKGTNQEVTNESIVKNWKNFLNS